ncbi:hypothetical protein V6N11_007844 [Hibiscus sabdariffa]|uniref:Uncharacterized protein n=1 Tax=Hibiscus sabdariffa TaxID=183260 RepID=A0ABR2PZH9_9ROSI
MLTSRLLNRTTGMVGNPSSLPVVMPLVGRRMRLLVWNYRPPLCDALSCDLDDVYGPWMQVTPRNRGLVQSSKVNGTLLVAKGGVGFSCGSRFDTLAMVDEGENLNIHSDELMS